MANVTHVMNHSALLGYYICDDCCPTNGSLEDVALMAQLYDIVKETDAYHVVCHITPYIIS